MSVDRCEKILERLERSEIALPSDLEGCSGAEIAALESKYGLRLPSVYRRFLRTMGRQCGWLFACEQAAVDYLHILDLTKELRESLGAQDPELNGRIPPDAFFILASLDEVDMFIRCEEGQDPPVYILNTEERTIEPAYGSVTEWLEAACETAEEGIAEGYLDERTIPRKTDMPKQPLPRRPAIPVPYALLCPGCGKRLVFADGSGEHSRVVSEGFLYNDAGTSTLVWTALDPSYKALLGQQNPWELSSEQQAAFEARLKPAPAGGSWRFANYPRCPHCRAAVGLPMAKSDLCLVYEGSLVLKRPAEGQGLDRALTEGAASPISVRKAKTTPGQLEISCSACAARSTFGPPSGDDARLRNLAFLYNDAGTSTLVWATTDPTFRSLFGATKPWGLSPEQQAAFEARLKPPRTGGQWRFANPARCLRCGEPISPPMIQCDLCLVYENSLHLQHWITGSGLNSGLRL